jgi:hypothetical protein
MDAATNVSNPAVSLHIYSQFAVLSRSGCPVDNPNCCAPPLCTRQEKNCQDEICELCKKRAIYEREQVDEAMADDDISPGTSLTQMLLNHLTCPTGSESNEANISDQSEANMDETPNPATATLEAEAAELVQKIIKALGAEVEPTEASKALSAMPQASSNETEEKIVEQEQHMSDQVPLAENQEEVRTQNDHSQIYEDGPSQ